MKDSPLKIVIVDDNTDYLFTMKTFLSRNGFDTATAEDGKTGLELIKETKPDLIMLDVMMEATFSGFEVCRRVRNDTELKSTPIIGITGMAEEIGVKFNKDADSEYFNPDAFFDKPVDKEALLKKIDHLLS
jgi:CheY-like chemotaxis protein